MPCDDSGSSLASTIGRASGLGPLSVLSSHILPRIARLVPSHPPPPGLVVERLRSRPEDGRGPRLVVVDRLECPQDELALALLEGSPQRQEHSVAVGLLTPLRWRQAERQQDRGG